MSFDEFWFSGTCWRISRGTRAFVRPNPDQAALEWRQTALLLLALGSQRELPLPGAQLQKFRLSRASPEANTCAGGRLSVQQHGSLELPNPSPLPHSAWKKRKRKLIDGLALPHTAIITILLSSIISMIVSTAGTITPLLFSCFCKCYPILIFCYHHRTYILANCEYRDHSC